MLLFIDTETTGLPNKYGSLGAQPYLVQLAAILCDDKRQPLAQMNRLIRPDGWTIPAEATAIHGLTTRYCLRNGVPLAAAMNEVMSLWVQANQVVAYNLDFDSQIISFSAARAGLDLPPRDGFCAMRASAKLVSDSGRWLKLAVAYRCFFGCEFDQAHDAMADVTACMRIYFAVHDRVAPAVRSLGSISQLNSASLKRAVAGAHEVEEHQELLDSLVQLHRTPFEPIKWAEIASQSPSEAPRYAAIHENAAVARLNSYRPNALARLLELDMDRIKQLQTDVERARSQDRLAYNQEQERYQHELAEMEGRKQFAIRMMSRDVDAYYEVMDYYQLGASPLVARNVVYAFLSGSAVEAFVYLNGPDIIPEQTKSLLKSGRVSVKTATKRKRFGIYKDHIASVVLRFARDFFSLLPLKTVLIHGYTSNIDLSTGNERDRCIVSCRIDSQAIRMINFDAIDPSDCLGSFSPALKATRGQFEEVTPLTLQQ